MNGLVPTAVFSSYVLLLAILAIAFSAWLVSRYFSRGESALPLGLFRIAYGLVLGGEVWQLYLNRAIAGPELRLDVSPLATRVLLLGWLAAIVCLVLGFATRWAAAANYLFSLWVFGAGGFTYHADYIYLGINALLPFAPVANRLSLDAQRRKLPRAVSQFWSRLLILVGIAFMYFDSSFYKIGSPLWTHGLGVWEPSSYPQTTWIDLSSLLDQKWLMLSMGYTVLLFEALFIFLMWSRRLRPLVFLVGIGLHFGVAAILALPWFGLLMASLYLLMLPEPLIPLVDPMPPQPAFTTPATRAALAGTTVLVFLQLTQTLGNPVLWRNHQPAVAERVASAAHLLSRPLLGIAPHNVFLDYHFHKLREVVTLASVDPNGRSASPPLLYRPSGEIQPLDSGRINTNWLSHGGTSEFCALAERIALGRSAARRFAILAKRTEEPTAWQAGWLREQMSHPWIRIGSIYWKDGHPFCEVLWN